MVQTHTNVPLLSNKGRDSLCPPPQRNIAWCFIDVCFAEVSAAGAGLNSTLPEVLPFVSSSFVLLSVLLLSPAASQRIEIERRRRGFNEGAGLNGGSEAAAQGPPRHVAGVRKDPGGPGGGLWERLWSAAGNRHCQCTGHLETGDDISCG